MKKPATNYMHDCYLHINSLFHKLILPGTVCTCIAVGTTYMAGGLTVVTLYCPAGPLEACTICGVTDQ